MDASRRKRRWLKPAVFLAAVTLAGWAVISNLRDAQTERLAQAWIQTANERGLHVIPTAVCVVPGFELNAVGKVLLGRRRILCPVFSDEDAEAMLTLPDCPVQLSIITGPSVAAPLVESLRDRFGEAVE